MDSELTSQRLRYRLKSLEKSKLNASNPYPIFGFSCQCVSPIYIRQRKKTVFLLKIVFIKVLSQSQPVIFSTTQTAHEGLIRFFKYLRRSPTVDT